MGRPQWMEQMEPVGGGVFGWIGIVLGLILGAVVVAAAVYGYVASISNTVRHPVQVRRVFCLYRCDRPTFRIRNDTGQNIFLRHCDHHCGTDDGFDEPHDVSPGAALRIRLPGLTGVHDWYAVDRESGARLGCVVLDEDASYHGVWTIAASAAGSCTPGTGPTPARHAAA